jgi:NDP-sugar pyrophosphorylase family protein
VTLEAVVLAAGAGTRLRPLTLTAPKPMLPVGNKPLLAANFARLREAGLSRVGVNRQIEHAQIESCARDAERLGVNVTWRVEKELTGPAGALLAFEDLLGSSELVVVSGDALHDIDVRALIAAHREGREQLTVVMQEVEDAGRYGVATLDADGYVASFEEKPAWAAGKRALVSCGVYCIDTALVAAFPRGRIYDFGSTGLIAERLAAGQRVRAFVHRGYWTDIGTPQTYWQANLDVVAGRVSIPGVVPTQGPRGPQVLLGNVDGPVIVGRDVQIGRGASIVGPSVVGEGSKIEDGAIVQHSVLLPGSRVLAGQHVVGAIVARAGWSEGGAA